MRLKNAEKGRDTVNEDIFGLPDPDALLELLAHDGARERFLAMTLPQRKAIVSGAKGMFPDEMRTYFERMLMN